jgi:YidC/Oxa1 family membrane protein insertase
MFITLPIFLIVYRVVTILRPLKATSLFGIWNFGTTPMSQIFSGQFVHMGWTFLFFLAIVIPAQFLSMKLPQHWARKRNKNATATSEKGNKQFKKTRMMQTIFAVVMAAVVVFSAVGVGVYWFLNSLFSLAQSYIMHVVIIRNRRKGGKLEDRLKSLGID